MGKRERETDRKTDRDRERERDRETNRETDRVTNRATDIQRESESGVHIFYTFADSPWFLYSVISND